MAVEQADRVVTLKRQRGLEREVVRPAAVVQYVEEAERRNMSPRMLVEFIDGSKTMVEMAAIANATGLVPDKPGLHGPRADLVAAPTPRGSRARSRVLTRNSSPAPSVSEAVMIGVWIHR